MTRVALRGIRAHLVRWLLSLLAVALGVAFVAGTFSLRTMLSSTFTGIVESSMVGDVYVRGASEEIGGQVAGQVGEARNPVPLSLADDVAAVDGVAHALPDLGGSVVLVGADGTAVQSTQAPSFAVALWPEDRSAQIVAGRAPVGPGEIALEDATLAASGLALGEETTLVLGGEIRTVEVVGEATAGGPMAGATIVLVDPEVAEAVFAPGGLVETITVYAEPGADEADLAARVGSVVAAAAPADAPAEAVTGTEMRAAAHSDVQAMLGFITTFLLVFALISLFVGAFIITNTFAMSVRERTREFALLRAVGASPAQVFASVLIQATVVGVVGSGLGILGGLGLVEVTRGALQAVGMTLAGDLPVDGFTIGVSLAVGTVVSVLAAALPARRAATVPPVDAIRDDVATPERSLRLRAAVGASLLGLGAAAVVLAAVRPDDDGAGLLLGLGAAGVLFGVLALAPVLARRVLGVLSIPFVAAFRPAGRLARGNVVRNPRRVANTAGALVVGMALVGAAGVLAASTQASTRAIVDQEVRTDLVLRTDAVATIPSAAVEGVRAVDGVTAVDTFAAAAVGVGTDGDEQTYIAVAMDPGMVGRTMDVEVVEGSDVGAVLAAGDVAVQHGTARDAGWSLGEAIEVQGPAGARTVEIGAFIDSPAIGAPLVLAPADLDALVPATQQQVMTAFVTVAEGADLAVVRAGVTDAVRPYVVIGVMDTEEFVSALAEQVDQVLVILYALLGLSVVIAVLGIVNTLALSVIERTREIGLLRAVGLGRFQLAGTITVESVLTAVFGTVVGLAVGVGLAAAMPRVFADEGLRTLAVPWSSLGVMVGIAVVVGVLAAVWPAVRAARLPVLTAIAD